MPLLFWMPMIMLRGLWDIAEENARALGWEPIVTPHATDRIGYLAGKDRDRLDECLVARAMTRADAGATAADLREDLQALPQVGGGHRAKAMLAAVRLAMALVTNLFTLRIRKLPVGRAWEALREDEVACRALGINPTTVKLSAFAIGAMFGGFAGCFFATRQGFISPESFTFIESATILAIVVLGGMGSQMGVVLAAILLVSLPEFGRAFAEFRMLIFGAAMVAVGG